jgi:phosphoglucomutase
MTARSGADPGELYRRLTERFGASAYRRVEVPTTHRAKTALARISPQRLSLQGLAGDPIRDTLTTAPGNGAPIGGVKIVAQNCWFAARPSGTEDVFKFYAESFLGEEHVERVLAEGEDAVRGALTSA